MTDAAVHAHPGGPGAIGGARLPSRARTVTRGVRRAARREFRILLALCGTLLLVAAGGGRAHASAAPDALTLQPTRTPRPSPAPPQTARLVRVDSPDTLLVEGPEGLLRVRVQGVHADPVCRPAEHLAWARRLLPPGSLLEVGGGPGEVRTVGFDWRGRPLDWGFVVLRTGHALPGSLAPQSAGQPTGLARSYAWAAHEARVEGRGLWSQCGRDLARFRRVAGAAGVPAEVLYGIAMVESRHGSGPWPWTLNVAGRACFFPSRLAAWRAMASLQSHHFDLFDVGIMQVNWHYHRNRFRTAWEALDPDVNQRVAADILREELVRTGRLAAAIARYHSADALEGLAYLRRLEGVLARHVGESGRAVEGLAGLAGPTARGGRP